MKLFLRFLLWQMRTEHRIGSATGMNPRYLHKLSASITALEGDLHLLELSE